MLYGLLSRSMRERSLGAWCLEIGTHILFYGGPWLIPFPDLLHYLAKNYFGGDYVALFRIMMILSATLPWFIASGFYFTLYYKKFPFIEKYRIQEWVWNREDSPRKEQYMELVRKTVKTMFLKNFLSSTTMIYLFFPYVFDTTRDMVAYVDNMPSCLENFTKIMLCLFFFDTGFYWTHRLLHAWPRMYRYHKDHHAYYVPTALAGVWMHDIDDIVTSLACGLIPAYFLGLHAITFYMLNIVNITHSTYDHCGYHLPYDPMQLIPLGCHNDSHNAHHSLNKDNYGLYWRHWDVIMGSDKLWLRYEQDREEAVAFYKLLNGALQAQTQGDAVDPRALPALEQLQSGQRTLMHAGGEYRVLATGAQGVRALEHGGIVVRDGVPLVRVAAEQAEIESGEDNLAFTYRTRIAVQAAKQAPASGERAKSE